jgi:hypothetical protein
MVNLGVPVAADVHLRSSSHLRGYPASRCGVDRHAGRSGQGREAAISLTVRLSYLRLVYIGRYGFLRFN